MQPIWSLLLVLAAFFLILHLRNRRRRPAPTVQPYTRRVEGFQVVAYLHPRISRGCLFDHGMQFGKGFRRKEGPALPHDEHCGCRVVPFSFTSSEVFEGALRRGWPIASTIEGLPEEEARRLIDRLREASAQPLPGSVAEALEQVGLEDFPSQWREPVEQFMRERYVWLREQQEQADSGPAVLDAPGE